MIINSCKHYVLKYILEKSKLLEYGASNCDCKFQDSDFLSKLCCLKPPYNDLMPIKDRILRNDCNTSDACNRFQNIHIPDGEVFDYIVVGGGVAGEYYCENRIKVLYFVIEQNQE